MRNTARVVGNAQPPYVASTISSLIFFVRQPGPESHVPLLALPLLYRRGLLFARPPVPTNSSLFLRARPNRSISDPNLGSRAALGPEPSTQLLPINLFAASRFSLVRQSPSTQRDCPPLSPSTFTSSPFQMSFLLALSAPPFSILGSAFCSSLPFFLEPFTSQPRHCFSLSAPTYYYCAAVFVLPVVTPRSFVLPLTSSHRIISGFDPAGFLGRV